MIREMNITNLELSSLHINTNSSSSFFWLVWNELNTNGKFIGFYKVWREISVHFLNISKILIIN